MEPPQYHTFHKSCKIIQGVPQNGKRTLLPNFSPSQPLIFETKVFLECPVAKFIQIIQTRNVQKAVVQML